MAIIMRGPIIYLAKLKRFQRGLREGMVVGFTITYAIGAYHHFR
jgi:hypothetical protein